MYLPVSLQNNFTLMLLLELYFPWKKVLKIANIVIVILLFKSKIINRKMFTHMFYASDRITLLERSNGVLQNLYLFLIYIYLKYQHSKSEVNCLAKQRSNRSQVLLDTVINYSEKKK